MKKSGVLKLFKPLLSLLVKAGSVFLTALLIFRKREKLRTFFSHRNVIVASMYGILVFLIAFCFRIILALNWILQQAAGR
ncbi:hypothetical protein QA601_11860 [Chitinispirillales bacterium ANBcel5]|uniref:hypothetical protein n=1 Tax=Cellulosispirillum alkaliphilum TaxID=3039283 RepID=UPI002A59383E|nr:hypothetical protein [Chitinispirillales bacterium ANBcel5]